MAVAVFGQIRGGQFRGFQQARAVVEHEVIATFGQIRGGQFRRAGERRAVVEQPREAVVGHCGVLAGGHLIVVEHGFDVAGTGDRSRGGVNRPARLIMPGGYAGVAPAADVEPVFAGAVVRREAEIVDENRARVARL